MFIHYNVSDLAQWNTAAVANTLVAEKMQDFFCQSEDDSIGFRFLVPECLVVHGKHKK